MKKKEKNEEVEKKCNCKNGGECTCGDDCQCGKHCTCGDDCQCGKHCTCGDDCKCGNDCCCGNDCKCRSNKKYYLKVFILSFVGILLFLGGLITGAVLLYNSDIEKEKNETNEKGENIYKFDATSNILSFRDITRNNNYKEGTYIVDYHSDFEDTKYEFSVEFKGKYGVDGDSITMRFEDKVVEYKCDNSCNDETKLYINSDFEYVVIAQMTAFLPIGIIDIYDFSGNLVKSFDNVVNAYYDCDDGLNEEKYIRADVDYSESLFRNTTIYLVENFEEENHDWNWFNAPVSLYKVNFETLETEKISEFNACFSQQ